MDENVALVDSLGLVRAMNEGDVTIQVNSDSLTASANLTIAADGSTQVTLIANANGGTAKTIGPAGGSITTTGEDGTVYRLDVPENALVENVEIRMSDLVAVEGLPGGNKFTAGV